MDYKQAYEKFTADAKKSQDIKVGDKVRYTGLSEYDLTRGNVYEVVSVNKDLVEVFDDAGDYNTCNHSECEPVTDAPQAVPDYNNGEWHGWNGGECPVHPKSEVQGLEPGGADWTAQAKCRDWESFKGAFRVTKPYVEPKKPREVWVLFADSGVPVGHFLNKADAMAAKWGNMAVSRMIEADDQ